MSANIILGLACSLRKIMESLQHIDHIKYITIMEVISNIEYQVVLPEIVKDAKQATKDLKTRLQETLTLMRPTSLSVEPLPLPEGMVLEEPYPSPTPVTYEEKKYYPEEWKEGEETTVLDFLNKMDEEEENKNKKRKVDVVETKKQKKKKERKQRIKNLPPLLMCPTYKYGGKSMEKLVEHQQPPPIGTGYFNFPPLVAEALPKEPISEINLTQDY